MDSKPVAASRSVLVHWTGVSDINSAGFVHGGTVLKLADEAAALAAVRHSGRRVVTAGLDRVAFVVPIELGDLITLSSSINAVWRTSMEVGVRVTAERPRHGAARHTNSAYFTMVALDEEGHPCPVPPLVAESEEERRREREAQVRRRNRLTEREDLLRHRGASG